MRVRRGSEREEEAGMGATGRKKREKLSSMSVRRSQTSCVLVSIREKKTGFMSSASYVQQEKVGPNLDVQTVWDLEQKEEKRERGGSCFSSLKTWSSCTAA